MSLAAKGGRVRRFRVPGSKRNLRVAVSRVLGGALTRLLHMGDVRDAPCCFLHVFNQFIFECWTAHISLFTRFAYFVGCSGSGYAVLVLR